MSVLRNPAAYYQACLAASAWLYCLDKDWARAEYDNIERVVNPMYVGLTEEGYYDESMPSQWEFLDRYREFCDMLLSDSEEQVQQVRQMVSALQEEDEWSRKKAMWIAAEACYCDQQLPDEELQALSEIYAAAGLPFDYTWDINIVRAAFGIWPDMVDVTAKVRYYRYTSMTEFAADHNLFPDPAPGRTKILTIIWERPQDGALYTGLVGEGDGRSICVQ